MSTHENSVYGIIKKYVDHTDINADEQINNAMLEIISKSNKKDKQIVLVCIGTMRAMGDSVAPRIGTKLESFCRENNITLIGTEDNQCHAKSFYYLTKDIDSKNSLVIAVDACLTDDLDYIGQIKISNGVITPGAGVGKDLGSIGDIGIAIINADANGGFEAVRAVDEELVNSMANATVKGLRQCLKTLISNKTNMKGEMNNEKAI